MIIYNNIYNYNYKIGIAPFLKGLLSPISNLLKGVLRGFNGSCKGLNRGFVGSYTFFVASGKW